MAKIEEVIEHVKNADKYFVAHVQGESFGIHTDGFDFYELLGFLERAKYSMLLDSVKKGLNGVEEGEVN